MAPRESHCPDERAKEVRPGREGGVTKEAEIKVIWPRDRGRWRPPHAGIVPDASRRTVLPRH